MKTASGSRGLSAGLVCRVKYGEWVKRIVGGVWSVGSSMASGSKELATACGLSGQVWRVGQEACRRVVCRVKFGKWVKGIVDGVWSVGASLASGSKELATACGLVARKRRVGQRNCRRMWSVGASLASGSKELSAGVVCRREKGA